MFTFKIAKIDVQDVVSEFSTSVHFQQLPLWANFKSLHGWTVLRFNVEATIENKELLKFSVSVLVRKFMKFFSLAYIPMGPDCIVSERSFYLQMTSELTEALKLYLPKNTFCVRIDPPIDFDSPEERCTYLATENLGLKNAVPNSKLCKALVDIQPPDTVVLDISASQDELLKNMKSKWRYNIKLATRKGVTVKQYGSDHIDTFYKLFKITADRDSIATHEKSYYDSLLKLSEAQSTREMEQSKVILYVAYAPANTVSGSEKLGEPLAGIIVMQVNGGEAIYLYGASSDQRRNLMPAYLLQWTAIQDAQEYGCKTYDFYGIPPTDDENHPMHGLWQFKTGFGGENVHRIGSLDNPMSWIYTPYRKVEKIRAWYYKDFKKKHK